jgi:hypothetical protein
MGSRVFGKVVKVSVGAVTLAAALSACGGGEVKAGSAVTFDKSRITTVTLDDDVTTWSKEFNADRSANALRKQAEDQAQSAALPYDPTSPSRSVLFWLINLRIWDRAAELQHVTVTPADVDQVVQGRFQGEQNLDAYALALGLPTSKARDLARSQAIQRAIAGKAGLLPSNAASQPSEAQSAAADKLLNVVFTQATKDLKIRVNPRFGRYPLLNQAGQVTYTLSKPDPGLNGSAALGS